MKKHLVIYSRRVWKNFFRIPLEIREAVFKWVEEVERFGLAAVRKNGGKGLHDEPLKGNLKALRSIRLNRSWRLYYYEKENEETIIVRIERIDKHEY